MMIELLLTDNPVEEIYKLISQLPIDQQSEIINKLLNGSGLIVMVNNGCVNHGCVTDNTINFAELAKYEQLAQRIEEVAAQVRELSELKNLRN